MIASIEDLKGKTLKQIRVLDNNCIYFVCDDNTIFEMFHEQDCCERVYIEDITGNLEDIMGSPITLAEESSNRTEGDDNMYSSWTFYKLATVKGYVDLRWGGTSSIYYSTDVSVHQLSEKYTEYFWDEELDEGDETNLYLTLD